MLCKGMSAFYIAAKLDHYYVVRRLLLAKAEIDKPSSKGATAIILANVLGGKGLSRDPKIPP